MEAALAAKRNELTEAQDRLKTVGKEGYMRLAAEVETYKVRVLCLFVAWAGGVLDGCVAGSCGCALAILVG